jgi:acetolactate synthase-1/2/3 large subunit
VQKSGTTADAVVETLVAHGVDTVFGLPGAQTYSLFDALARYGLRVIGGRHEQAVGYMAFGYAQATGRVGVYTVVPGPGMLNSAAALVSAYGAGQPVMCLTSEVPSAFLGRGMGHLHELPDQLATLRSLTKWAQNVHHPAEAARVVADAFHEATSGRQRPVAVAVPWDVLGTSGPLAPAAPRPPTLPPVDADAVMRAAALLADARNPMIMVGGGARNAAHEVRNLAEFLQAPVVPFRSGKGVVDERHALGFSCASGFERWADTDVVVGIGSRMELRWFRWPDQPPGQRLVLVDVDPQQVVRLEPDAAVVADAAQGAQALLTALQDLRPPAADRTAEFAEVKAKKAVEVRQVGPEIEYLEVIREELPRDGYLVEELCQAGFASYFAFPVHEPRHFITCGHQGTLGFGFPTALGVKAAHPEAAVVSISGDGGFLFGAPELATAVQYGLAVVAIVFNNNAYGNVLLDQRRLFGPDRVLGAELTNPDFAALARTFGAAGFTVSTPARLRTALRRALKLGRPAVIEVKTELGVGAGPFTYLMPASRAG